MKLPDLVEEEESSRPSTTFSTLPAVQCVAQNFASPPEIQRIHNIVVQGTMSQYSVGGPSACTSICIFAASQMLADAATIESFNANMLDSIVQVGVCLHETSHNSSNQNHSSIDDLWSEGIFPDVLQHVKRGTTTSGFVSVLSFRGALLNGMHFALKENKSSVAIILTKPLETVLCYCTDVSKGG